MEPYKSFGEEDEEEDEAKKKGVGLPPLFRYITRLDRWIYMCVCVM